MARAETLTLLPLDRWAKLLGISPIHFNGVYSAYSSESAGCGSITPQWSWQDADTAGREDIALAIRAAEDAIRGVIGYPVAPQWIADEIAAFQRPAVRNVYATNFRNLRGQGRSVQTRWGQIISGGIKAKTLIDDAVAITYSDQDGDGYKERAQITVVTTVTDTNELAVYFPGESGADSWEIRPLEYVSISAGTATIRFRREQVPLPAQWNKLTANNINGDDDTKFLTTVDVYRVYNDPSAQATLQWEPLPDCGCGTAACEACAFETQTACLLSRDNRLGFFTVEPSSWDDDTEEFTTVDPVLSRMADKARLWYRAGYRGQEGRILVDMDPSLAWMVAILACTYLERPICGCDSVKAMVGRWAEDFAADEHMDNAGKRYQVAPAVLQNPLGTKRGAVETWRRLINSDWMLGRSAS